MKYINHKSVMKRMNKRLIVNHVFKTIFFIATLFALLVLAVLILSNYYSRYRLFKLTFSKTSVRVSLKKRV